MEKMIWLEKRKGEYYLKVGAHEYRVYREPGESEWAIGLARYRSPILEQYLPSSWARRYPTARDAQEVIERYFKRAWEGRAYSREYGMYRTRLFH